MAPPPPRPNPFSPAGPMAGVGQSVRQFADRAQEAVSPFTSAIGNGVNNFRRAFENAPPLQEQTQRFLDDTMGPRGRSPTWPPNMRDQVGNFVDDFADGMNQQRRMRELDAQYRPQIEAAEARARALKMRDRSLGGVYGQRIEGIRGDLRNRVESAPVRAPIFNPGYTDPESLSDEELMAELQAMNGMGGPR